MKTLSPMSVSNSKKSISGSEVKEELREILCHLAENQFLKIVNNNQVNFKHKNYSYNKQFLLDFVLETIDNKYILIRTSNSFRSDRIKISFYDFLGMQQYSEFSGEIVASILLFPDSVMKDSTFITNRNRFHNKEFFSPATHWLTFSEFKYFIENYCSEVNSLKDEVVISDVNVNIEEAKTSKAVMSKETGSHHGKEGNLFEKNVVKLIEKPINLFNYKSDKETDPTFKLICDTVLNTWGISKYSISKIEATNSIDKLKNLGSPKTDIHIKFYFEEAYKIANFSIKNTKATSVSCHDYRAADFIRVIAPDDPEFIQLINLFQETGSWKSFDQKCKDLSITLDVQKILNKYNEKIILWAITGEGDMDNLNNPKIQIANFLLTRNPETMSCTASSSTDYINKISSDTTRRGAPFSWTYPSKNRGQRIQLKMPV